MHGAGKMPVVFIIHRQCSTIIHSHTAQRDAVNRRVPPASVPFYHCTFASKTKKMQTIQPYKHAERSAAQSSKTLKERHIEIFFFSLVFPAAEQYGQIAVNL